MGLANLLRPEQQVSTLCILNPSEIGLVHVDEPTRLEEPVKERVATGDGFNDRRAPTVGLVIDRGIDDLERPQEKHVAALELDSENRIVGRLKKMAERVFVGARRHAYAV